ncbi:class II D-tagatose-bisphosphate aldolase non-catalytic subunit [Nocardia beijingensis]
MCTWCASHENEICDAELRRAEGISIDIDIARGYEHWERLAVGLTSLEMLQAVTEFTSESGKRIMLIASRNQAECAEFGGGYVNGMTPERLTAMVRSRADGSVAVCRDHGGPFLRDGDRGCNAAEAMQRAAASLREDVAAGFDLVHVDVHAHPGDKADKYERLAELVDVAVGAAAERGYPVRFEISLYGNDGIPTPIREVESDLRRVLQIVEPTFYVAQTGSLVRGIHQVGYFDQEHAGRLAGILAEFGVGLKEHNIDYSSTFDMVARSRSEVAAFNVAPELGVAQTRMVLQLATEYGRGDKAERFTDYVYRAGLWKKWFADESTPRGMAVLASGHYHFDSGEYRDLIDDLGTEVDVTEAVVSSLKKLMHEYCRALGPVPASGTPRDGVEARKSEVLI